MDSDISATPLWRQIRDALAAEIAAGRYPPGGRLPSEAALAARFAVNRHTVRRALADLRQAGAVTARRGAGVYVTLAPPTAYPLGRVTRFSANITRAGRAARHEIIRLETAPLSAAEAAALGVAAGAPGHLVATVGYADATPVVYAESVLPAAGLESFATALRETGSKTQALAACGVQGVTRRRTSVTAQIAGGAAARHLRVEPGAALLKTEGLDVAPDGRVVEWGLAWFAADRVTLVVDPADF